MKSFELRLVNRLDMFWQNSSVAGGLHGLQVGVDLQMRGLLALQLGVVQAKHRQVAWRTLCRLGMPARWGLIRHSTRPLPAAWTQLSWCSGAREHHLGHQAWFTSKP